MLACTTGEGDGSSEADEELDASGDGSDEEGADSSSGDDGAAEAPGAPLLPNGLPRHVAVAAGGRVRRRAVFADGAAPASGRGADSDDEASEGDDGAYGDLAAQRSGGAVGPSGRGAAGSGSDEDFEDAPPGVAPA